MSNDDKTFGPYIIATGKLRLGVSDLKQEKARDGSEWLLVGRVKYEFAETHGSKLGEWMDNHRYRFST